MTDPQGQVTGLLMELRGGDRGALDRLLPLVYEELGRIARRQLGRESAGHTLQTTALVHEAYLKLVDQTRAQWRDRAHFFAVASGVMRRILVDYARRHGAAKRGAGLRRVPLDEDIASLDDRAELLLALDEALERLAALDQRLARVVECRFFGGMSEEETAEALGVTVRTIRRDWVKAKGWLYRALGE
jgi:RNA polymerase sigma factor (TIGR02999 family)